MTARLRVCAIAAALGFAASPAFALPGDVDADCDVDIADVVLLERALAGHVVLTDEQSAGADLAPIGGSVNDGVVDVADLVTIKRIVARDANPATPGLAAPTLDAIQSVANPLMVSGDAPDGSFVTLYVNGRQYPHGASVTGGEFSFGQTNVMGRIPLADGENWITAVATSGSARSCSSAAQVATYDAATHGASFTPSPQNLVINNGEGQISSTQVWTPALTNGQPIVVNENLVVQAGAALTIQPGTRLRFAAGTQLKVENGATLQILGTAQNPPILDSTGATDSVCTGPWAGIWVNSSAQPVSVIEDAKIDCVITGLQVSHGGLAPIVGNAILRRSEISRWQSWGVYVTGNAIGAWVLNNRLEVGPGSGGIFSDSKGTSNDLGSRNTLQIKDNVIQGRSSGITLGARPDAVSGNAITGVPGAPGGGSGIYMYNTFWTPYQWSDPPSNYPTITITENTITGFCNGVVNRTGTTIVILDSNNIYGNENCTCSDPQSSCSNYTTDGTCPGSLPAENNWWGTTNLVEVEGKIHGCGIPAAPIDFVPYLDAPFDHGGDPVGGENLIQGEIYDAIAPAPGGDWMVVGTATVPSGESFTIPDGQVVRFSNDAELVVEGELVVMDENGDDVLFTALTAAGASPAVGHWKGIVVKKTSGGATDGHATIADAVIEYPLNGVTVTDSGSFLELKGSLIKKFWSAGVRVENHAAAHIHDNRNAGLGIVAASGSDGIVVEDVNPGVEVVIDNNEIKNASAAVRIENASPKLRGNLIKTSVMGVRISGTGSPLISEDDSLPVPIPNEITQNCWGIYVDAPSTQPTPIVRENKIHTNNGCPNGISGNYNYYVATYGSGYLALDADHNWWGGNPSTAASVAASIWDRSDPTPLSLPTVNFVPFYTTSAMDTLDLGNYLLGPVSSDLGDENDMLAPGSYTAVGTLVVDTGDVWRIGPGATIEFAGQHGLEVDGSLVVAGTSGSIATLKRSGTSYWEGIAASGAAASGQPKLDIQFARIENAIKAIEVKDSVAPVSIADSTIVASGTGISLDNAGSAIEPVTVERTDIDGYPGGYAGIHAIDSTFIADDQNEIWNVSVGILAAGSSTPTIGTSVATGNTIRNFNQFGILLTGVAGGSIVGNEIFNNPLSNPLIGTGILLDSSSPTIRNNSLHDLDIGILLLGNSAPVIGEVSPTQAPHNTITANRVGIRLEGTPTGSAAQQPRPTIQRNNLGGNDEVDLEVVKYPPAVDLVIDAKENWWGDGLDAPGIRGRIRLDPTSPVAVDFSNYLAAVGSMTPSVSPGLFSTVITQVSRISGPTLTPTLPSLAPLQVSMQVLGAGADVTFDIYEEDDDTRTNLIYRETRTGASGPQTFTWNGTNNQLPGADPDPFVDNEAYIYVVSAAGGLGSYDPPRVEMYSQANSVDPINQPVPYNVFQNDFLKMRFNVDNAPGRTTFALYQSQGGTLIRPIAPNVVFSQGTYRYFVYDGREPTIGALESIAEESHYFYVSAPVSLRPNHVVVEQARPRIQPPDFDPAAATPRIEVKSDPYLVINSYDQVSRIAYQLDQSASVTVQILDPSMIPVGAPLVSGASQQPGLTYMLTWSGVDALTAGGLYDLINGNYTFAITAANPSQPSLSTTYRGVIQVRQ